MFVTSFDVKHARLFREASVSAAIFRKVIYRRCFEKEEEEEEEKEEGKE